MTELEQLRSRLAEVSHREAWFRARAAQDVVALRASLKLLVTENRELRSLIRQRDTTVHELNLARIEDRTALQELTRDLETYAHLLARSEEDARLARSRLNELRASLAWRALAPIRSLQKLFAPPKPPSAPTSSPTAAAETCAYYLHTSPFRIFRTGEITLRGWLLPPAGRRISRARVRIGTETHNVTMGLEEPDVVRHHQLQPPNDRPGFAATFPVQSGINDFELEAELDGAQWTPVLATSLRVMIDETKERT